MPRRRSQTFWEFLELVAAAGVVLSLAFSACSTENAQTQQHNSGRAVASASGIPAPAAQASPADDGQWTMPAKNYASTRYTDLDQINASNVGQLKLAWTFSTGLTRGHDQAVLPRYDRPLPFGQPPVLFIPIMSLVTGATRGD